MAEAAQQEPTMEEILSSIRKIIADDGGDDAQLEEASDMQTVEVSEASDDSFDDLELTLGDSSELDELAEQLTADANELQRASVLQSTAADESFDDIDLGDDDFEEAVTAPEVYSAVPDIEDDFFETELEAKVEPELLSEVQEEIGLPSETTPAPFRTDYSEPLTEKDEDTAMSAMPAETLSPSAETSDALSDSVTAQAAAGSLGKLLSKVEVGPAPAPASGEGQTIEDVVRELLRPMLKDWLDANLPGLVEKHVEAEVQRIARMAR